MYRLGEKMIQCSHTLIFVTFLFFFTFHDCASKSLMVDVSIFQNQKILDQKLAHKRSKEEEERRKQERLERLKSQVSSNTSIS